MNRRFVIYNFGCKVNQEEGGAIAALFCQQGWREDRDHPELIVINTCTVTQVADKKARNLIRRLRRQHPQALLAVCGCYAQRAAAEIRALGGVQLIVGVDQRQLLPQLAEEYWRDQSRGEICAVTEISQSHTFQRIAGHSDSERSRAFLKIEDGCDQFCHYCIIPHVRGPVRSLPPEQALEQARYLLEQGRQEIVLTGIHIGAYGSDLGQPQALPRLIDQLCALPGLLRLRLGSIEPQQFTPELIEGLARQPRLCPHLHIPLQSGCDRTLAAMGRRYDSAFYASLLARLRATLGDIAITSDLMVGFPGETEEDFQISREFCHSCGLAGLHVFPYSRRQGTPAAALPQQVTAGVKAQRAAIIARDAAAAARSYAQRYLGQELTLLVEDEVELAGTTYLRGHSGNYLTLLLPADQDPAPVRTVRPVRWTEEGMISSEVRG